MKKGLLEKQFLVIIKFFFVINTYYDVNRIFICFWISIIKNVYFVSYTHSMFKKYPDILKTVVFILIAISFYFISFKVLQECGRVHSAKKIDSHAQIIHFFLFRTLSNKKRYNVSCSFLLFI